MSVNRRDRGRRSSSLSPPSDYDVESPKKQSYNFLQRVPPKKHCQQPSFVYRQSEFLRLTVDLIHKCKFKQELKEYLYLLDKGESICLSEIANSNVRKKMRHLLRVLYMDQNDGLYTKPSNCDISLEKLLDEFREYIEDKCRSMPKPKEPEKYTRNDRLDDNISMEDTLKIGGQDPTFTTVVDGENVEAMDLKQSLKSLRELHEEGFYVDYKEMQMEFIKKHKVANLWGMPAEEQLIVMNNQGDDANDHVTGNAVKSIYENAIRQVDSKAYKELIESGNDFQQNFA